MFEGICDVLHRELEIIEDKYMDSKTPMNPTDLAHIDTIAHALKSLATYKAMENADRGRRYDNYRRY